MISTINYANINGLWSAVLIEELWRLGVRHCCIAPGSRSAPLTFAVSAHSEIKRHVHFDERGLGFYALGLAKAIHAPVAIITTSGTAVANLLPAVIEAHQSGVPLILLTADRPPELIDCGANQAIDQPGLFGHYTGANLNLPTPTLDISLRWLLGSLDQAFARSCARSLPLHINCMFREPLYPHQKDGNDISQNRVYVSAIKPWEETKRPYTKYNVPKVTSVPEPADWAHFINGHGFIVVGRVPHGTDTTAILELSKQLGWPLVADVQSQLHGHPKAIAYADLLLVSADGKTLFQQADRVLQFGGYLISKRLDQFISGHNWQAYWMVDSADRRVDTRPRQTLRMVGDVEDICQALVALNKPVAPKVEWYNQCREVSDGLRTLVQKILQSQSEELNEQWLGANLGHCLFKNNLNKVSSLFLGNSLPIRMVEMFNQTHLPGVFTSRGASGIDGLIATASGCAEGVQNPMVLLMGDVAFFHDVNSLQLAKQATHPLVIVLVNNDGGGIFYMTTKGCSADQTAVAEEYFVTPHGLNARHGAALFGINYCAPDTVETFIDSFSTACRTPGCTVIEVTTPSGQGAQLMREIVNRVGQQ